MFNTKSSAIDGHNNLEQKKKINFLIKLIEPLVIHLLEYNWFYKLIILIRKIKRKISLLAKLFKTYLFMIFSTVSATPFSSNSFYCYWLIKHYPNKSDFKKYQENINRFNYLPKISIILPVYNPQEKYLKATIKSVIDQIYTNWELCVADDASTNPSIKETLTQYNHKDSRIKVIYRSENGHISACSNSALTLATGEFIALLDHDDILTPDALYEVVSLLNQHPDADMIYSDEDKILENGWVKEPFFKPKWCPDSFLSRMYTCHLGVYRKQLIDTIGGFRIGFEGAQDYDLVLRLTEKTNKIYHIPKVLYHWRISSTSTVQNVDNKSYGIQATQKALTEAVTRRKQPGYFVLTDYNYYIVRYQIIEPELVSIIIPSKDLGTILDRCLDSIFTKTTYPNYEVILIDNGTTETEALTVIKKWQTLEPKRFKTEKYDIPFNYSKLNNYGAKLAEGKYLLLLNNDTEVITPDWIDAMVEQAQRPDIGAVGVLLLYPDNTVQHSGVIGGIGGIAGHSHKYYPSNVSGYFGQLQTINNYSAVTAACLMCRKEVFEEVHGFEEELTVAFNDVDFCFKILSKGYRNIYLPHVKLYHYESKSRGYENTFEKYKRSEQEIQYMQNKWSHIINNDPCYSPNLTQSLDNFSINIDD